MRLRTFHTNIPSSVFWRLVTESRRYVQVGFYLYHSVYKKKELFAYRLNSQKGTFDCTSVQYETGQDRCMGSIFLAIVFTFLRVNKRNYENETILSGRMTGVHQVHFNPSLLIVKVKIPVVWLCTIHHTTLDIQICASLLVLECTVKN